MGILSEQGSTEQLTADFMVVIADAEALLKATADQGGDQIAQLRAKTQESLRVVRDSMAETQAALLAKTKAAAKATDEYVHENPWKAIGFSAALGLAVGLLIGRR